MRTKASTFVFVGLLLTARGTTILAHHSLFEEFDGKKHVALMGTVTKFEWVNPHAFLYIDAKDPRSGKVVNWTCQLASPNALATLGWTSTTLRSGMTVNVMGTLARDGSNKLNAREVLVDGRLLIVSPSEQRGTST